jgi:hypothetical protein
MISINISLAIFLALAAGTHAAKTSLRVRYTRLLQSMSTCPSLTAIFPRSVHVKARELAVCDTLKGCYFINIKTRNATLLDGKDSFVLDPSNEFGYSVRCDMNGVDELDFMKFKYENVVQDQFGLPRFMFGSAFGGEYINPVEYLSTCGRKSLTVEGHIWTSMCFTKTFEINIKNPAGERCASAPNVPVVAPVKAPVMTPVSVPMKAPLSTPVKPPVPVTTPVRTPMKAPVTAPVSVPVKAPVPMTAPVRTPTASCKAVISGFTLIDADAQKDIMPLKNFKMTKTKVNIRAEVATCVPKVVDSVLLELDGVSRCEQFQPYAVFADNSKTDVANNETQYYGKIIGMGDHIIKATPYSGLKCDGVAGATFTRAFTVL